MSYFRKLPKKFEYELNLKPGSADLTEIARAARALYQHEDEKRNFPHRDIAEKYWRVIIERAKRESVQPDSIPKLISLGIGIVPIETLEEIGSLRKENLPLHFEEVYEVMQLMAENSAWERLIQYWRKYGTERRFPFIPQIFDAHSYAYEDEFKAVLKELGSVVSGDTLSMELALLWRNNLGSKTLWERLSTAINTPECGLPAAFRETFIAACIYHLRWTGKSTPPTPEKMFELAEKASKSREHPGLRKHELAEFQARMLAGSFNPAFQLGIAKRILAET